MAERGDMILAGERVEPLAHPALHWPAQRTLIVADLHWGKCETFRVAGVPLPAGVIEADLARLGAALDATGARRLLVLGDLLHAGAGLTPALVATVGGWLESRRVELVLVPGNHDRCGVPGAWHARITGAEWREGPFVFRHDPGWDAAPPRRGRDPSGDRPAPRAAGYVLAGHVHPRVRLSSAADSVSLPCFVFGPDLGVLPSFSLFTRGRRVDPRPGTRIVAVAGDRLVPLPARPAGKPAGGRRGTRR